MSNQPDYLKDCHRFMIKKFKTLELFSKEDFFAEIPNQKNLNTYWTKKIRPLLIKLNNDEYRVSEFFRRYLNFCEFCKYWSQSEKGISYYTPNSREFISFQFFLPMTNELVLRDSLDALFYSDRLKRRISAIDRKTLIDKYPINNGESDIDYLNRITLKIADIFGGYSISHVQGRFRGQEMMTLEESTKLIQDTGQKYIYDETTAVIRFIIPIQESESELEDCKRIRWIFQQTFVQTILESINGEEEIWLLETGINCQLLSWSRKP